VPKKAPRGAAWMTVCGMARRATAPKYTGKSATALAGAARRKVGHCRAFLFLNSRCGVLPHCRVIKK